jgi:hypothetical protein
MKHLLSLGLLLLLLTTTTWSQDTWVKVLGGSDDESGNSITRTSDDGILITGYSLSNDGDFKGMNKGSEDVFIIKLDKDGQVLWKKTLGGSGDEFGTSLTTTEDGGMVLTGTSYSNDGDFKGMKEGGPDIFVIKLNSNGEVIWKKTFGGSDEEGVGYLTTTEDGGIVLTGWTYSKDGDFKRRSNSRSCNIFVIKLNSNGEVIWKKTFGGEWDKGISLSTTEDGGIVVTGTTSSNNGDFKGMNKGSTDIFVIKLNSNGEVIWKKTFGGSNVDFGHSLTTTSDGGLVLTGFTKSNDGDFKGMNKGDVDIFIIKLNSLGNVEWKKTFGGSEWDWGKSLTTTSDGGLVLTGYTNSNDGDFKGMNKGDVDIFIIKLNSLGNVLWKRTYGGRGIDLVEHLSMTSDGGIMLIGGTPSDVGDERNDGDFWNLGKGGQDIFIMKLDKDGNLKPKGKNSKKK